MAGKGPRPAAGGQQQHVLGGQFFGHGYEGTVLRHLDVVAASEQAHPQDVAVDNVVNQRFERIISVHFAQRTDDSLGGEATHRGVGVGRDVDPCPIAFAIGGDGSAEDVLCRLAGCLLVELDVGRARHFGDRHSSDQLGVVTVSHVGQGRHDALVVNDHSV